METRKMKLALSAGALALSLALAGCGGGGSTQAPGPTPEQIAAQEAMKRAEMQTAAIETARDAARMAIDDIDAESPTQAQVDAAESAVKALDMAVKAAADVEDTSSYAATVMDLNNLVTLAQSAVDAGTSVDAAKQAQADAEAAQKKAEDDLAAKEEADRIAKEKADRETMNDMAKKLHKGLGASDATVTNLAVADGKFTASYDADGNGSDATAGSITLSPSGDLAPMISGWAGTDYQKQDGSEVHHAVVYDNKGPNRLDKFSKTYGADSDANPLGTDGFLDQADLTANPKRIAGDAFASGAGDKHHTENNGDMVTLAGTFHGAAGTYTCTQTAGSECQSSFAPGAITLTGGWRFTPAADAMTVTSDANYIRFGWWAHDDGSDVEVVAFAAPTTTATSATSIGDLQGKATYVGGATGKAAVYNKLSDNNMGGVFTATATLEADFGNDSEGGMLSGMIDNFSLDGEEMDWSVTLKKTVLDAANASTSTTESMMTVWSIGGTKADEAGEWSASLYETDMKSNVPMAAAGKFKAEYGAMGHMVGAFGATYVPPAQ